MSENALLASYISEPELAQQLKKSRRTIQRWRRQRRGPAWHQVGNSIIYRIADVERWLDNQRRQPRPGEEFDATHRAAGV